MILTEEHISINRVIKQVLFMNKVNADDVFCDMFEHSDLMKKFSAENFHGHIENSTKT